MGKYHAFAHRGGGIATADVLHRREAAGSLRPHPRMLFARACGRAHCTGVGAIEARILHKNMHFSTSNRSVIRSGAVPRVFTTLQQPHQGAHTAGRRTAPKRTRLHIFKFFFRFHHGNIRSLPYGSHPSDPCGNCTKYSSEGVKSGLCPLFTPSELYFVQFPQGSLGWLPYGSDRILPW